MKEWLIAGLAVFLTVMVLWPYFCHGRTEFMMNPDVYVTDTVPCYVIRGDHVWVINGRSIQYVGELSRADGFSPITHQKTPQQQHLQQQSLHLH